MNGREPEKLPPVRRPEEIARFLEAVAGLRNRVVLTTAYAAKLRIGEVCRLKAASDGGAVKGGLGGGRPAASLMTLFQNENFRDPV